MQGPSIWKYFYALPKTYPPDMWFMFFFIYLMYLCPYVGTFDLLHLVTSAIPLHPVKVLSIVCIVCMLFKHFLRRLYAVKHF